jgi:endonuclease/exonuclease/phosphatase family metal-dependent hydrolase
MMILRGRRLLLPAVAALSIATSCGGTERGDAAADASTDAMDSSADASMDASIDTLADAATDVSADADAGTRGWAVLSLNLHCLETDGTGFADNTARFAAIARDAVENGVRAMLLQEVCDDGTTDALALLESALESESGGDWRSAYAFAHVAWEGTPREADEGVAILADAELEAAMSFTHHAQGSLRRVMLHASLPDALRNLTLTTFHLDHEDAAVRGVQARELATAALLHGGVSNALLAGDLNDLEGSAAHDALLSAGYRDASESLRASRIDHVFIHRGASYDPTSAELLWDGPSDRVSDHPGVLVRLAQSDRSWIEPTVVELEVDAGFGNTVFVRGDQAPLDWDEGWPALNTSASLWRFATTELSGTFEYKALRNDTDWSTGDNFIGSSGVTNRETVSF